MKILLNFNLRDNDYIIFEENENFYLSNYKNNKFKLIKTAAKNDLKNLVNQLITKPITKEEFLNNGIIIKNKDINIEKDLDKAIKLSFENYNSKNLENNCLLLNENSQENNTNQQCIDSNQNDKKFKTLLIRYPISIIAINFLIFLIWSTAIDNQEYNGVFGGLEAIGSILIISLIQNFLNIIIEIVFSIIISKKYLPNIKKSKIFFYMLATTLIFGVCLSRFIFIPYFFRNIAFINIFMLFIVASIPYLSILFATIVTFLILRNNKINKKKCNITLIIISFIILTPIAIIIATNIYEYYIDQKQSEEEEWWNQVEEDYQYEYNSCKIYIASTNNYVYCETHTGNLKRINIDTKEEKIYTNSLWNFYNHKIDENNNYIYYISANEKSEELHVINANTGTENKISDITALHSKFFESNDNKIYFTVSGYRNNDYSNEITGTYMYDPITKKFTQLNTTLDNIEYVNNNEIYYVENNNLYIYNTINQSNHLIDQNIIYYDHNPNNENQRIINKINGTTYSINYQLLLNNQVLYIYNIPEAKLYLQDNSVYYYNIFIDNEKIYLTYKTSNSENYSIAYIDLNDNNYNIVKTNIEIESYDPSDIFIKNNFAYYINLNNHKNISKTNLITGETKVVYDKYVARISAIDNQYLYYSTKDGDKFIRLDINTDNYEIIDQPKTK